MCASQESVVIHLIKLFGIVGLEYGLWEAIDIDHITHSRVSVVSIAYFSRDGFGIFSGSLPCVFLLLPKRVPGTPEMSRLVFAI